MIGEKLGHFLDAPLGPLARRIPLSPDQLTLLGFAATLVAALVLVRSLAWGGVLILVASLFDLLDGLVARQQDRCTPFGAFLDSLLDRYADAAIFIALAVHLALREEMGAALAALVTLVGALATSYARARAEGLGIDCRVGLLERPERILLVALGCLTGWIGPVLWLLLPLTHITVLQRALRVRRELRPLPEGR